MIRLLAFALSLIAAPALAEKDARVFFFGNSLIHHLTDSDETTVPYWLAELARAGGHGFAADGTWGFPADFARNLPPEPQWQFAGVERLLTNPRGFRMAGFDTVILSPPNFVQYADPSANTLDGSMEDLIGRTFDWVQNQTDARLLIYEGWAKLGDFDSFPPSARAEARFHTFNQGDYDTWYRQLTARLAARLPAEDIGLIPVAPVISWLVTEGPLAGIGAEALYSDDAPHGTATTYLLAAMVTYASLYNEEPPLIGLPVSIAPALRDNYPAVAGAVWARINGAVTPLDLGLSGAATEIPETGLADPSLGFGLAGIDDWSPQQPFIDVMKTARPWIGHQPGRWGGVDFADLRAGGFLSPEGWPLAIPDGVERLEALILTDLPVAARGLAGEYRVSWAGTGTLTIGGRATDVRVSAQEASFAYTPGPGPVAIGLAAIDPRDPIRDIRVIRADQLDLDAAGAVFNPDWVARIADARMIRLMDWMKTNGSPQVTWEDRPLTSDFSYAWRGVPAEVMIDLANQIGADPWFTLPHQADDGYIRAFATLARDGLDSRRVAHAELSNEMWNFIFPQAVWAQDQARARWGEDAGEDAWMQFAGLRAAVAADIWTEVYGDQAEARLVRVFAAHTGWPGLEAPALDAPLAVAEGLPPPGDSFDAYAVAGYFGHEIATEAQAPDLRRWIADGEATARVSATIRAGSLRELTERLWPHHAGVARDRGYDLLMYEGGAHVVGLGPTVEDEGLTAFLTAYNYSPEVAGLYADLIRAWRGLGGGAFNAFVDLGAPSKWGSWGALRHLDDMNPRWATLTAWNALPLDSPRAGLFGHGVTRRGAGLIEGTPHADVLIGGPGDDIFNIVAGSDRVLGGGGRDRAILPGRAADWALAHEGEVIWMLGPAEEVRLSGIAEITFAEDPDSILSGAALAPAADRP